MLQKIGFVIISIGIMCADSENLLIPTAIVAVGAVLLFLGNRTEASNGK